MVFVSAVPGCVSGDRLKRWMALLVLLTCGTVPLAGCTTATAIVAGGAIGATVAGGHAPAQELEQVYYLGVFDPVEQIDPTVYRLTVRGQASAISGVRFGSGWVPAGIIDGLGTSVTFDSGNKDDPRPIIQQGSDVNAKTFETGRRLVLFGPEGFRPAPANHRLVVVMGSSPEQFFKAMDESLGHIASIQEETRNTEVKQKLFRALLEAQSEERRLREFKEELARDFPQGGAP